ncbi:MAG TPA: hydroxyisourate hydrolase [Vicinamibacterales bacterium]|nr:hydroxyisourate hydrolase [Vicinamibacterales bacterium]
MARISTHVLDTARGVPAEGIEVSLCRLRGDERVVVASSVTNADGRTDVPLLAGDAVETGIYELTFHAGAYLARTSGRIAAAPPFLDEIVIRFGVGDATASYHVPLLLSPFGYSTYRGS